MRHGLAWPGQMICHFEIDFNDMENQIPIPVYETTKTDEDEEDRSPNIPVLHSGLVATGYRDMIY